MHQSLHEEALRRVKDFTASTLALLEILTQIDQTKSYLALGYGSLWSYVTTGLKLSESQAHQFISVMRKSIEVPALKAAVAKGEVSLPKAALIVKELTPQNQNTWIDNAKSLGTRDLKAEILKCSPQTKTAERITPKSKDLFELKVGLSKEVIQSLERVQDILSQKNKRTVKIDEALKEITAYFLEKNCPQKRAERLLCADKVKPVKTIPEGRISYPAWIKHTVHKAEGSQCSATLPNGKRCEQRRFLEIHHKVPLHKGGSNHPGNLTLLCSGHHSGQHFLMPQILSRKITSHSLKGNFFVRDLAL